MRYAPVLALVALAIPAMAAQKAIDNGALPSATSLAKVLPLDNDSDRAQLAQASDPKLGVTCVNCQTVGSLNFLTSGFTIGGQDQMDISDFLQRGILEFETKGVGTNITLNFTVAKGFSTGFTYVTLSLANPYTLSIADAAIPFHTQFRIPVNLQMNSPVESDMSLLGGFALAIPDGSRIYIDMGNSHNSYVSGFNQTDLTPMIQTKTTGPEFKLLSSMVMSLYLGDSSAELLSGSILLDQEVAALNSSVSMPTHVNDNCESPKGGDKIINKAFKVQNTASVGFFSSGNFKTQQTSEDQHTWQPPNFESFNSTLTAPSIYVSLDDILSGPANVASALPSSSASPSGSGSGSGSASSSSSSSAGAPATTKTPNAAPGSARTQASSTAATALFVGLVALVALL